MYRKAFCWKMNITVSAGPFSTMVALDKSYHYMFHEHVNVYVNVVYL